MALTLITGVIFVVYTIAAPKPAPAPVLEPQSSHAIEVYQATWGLRCNDEITRALQRRQFAPVEKDEKGQVIPPKPLALVQPNNVLSPVSEACNGKLACQIDASPERLGVDPLESCYKELNVQYRCFTYDRLQIAKAEQGTTLTIDCRENANPSTQAPTSASTAPAAAQQ